MKDENDNAGAVVVVEKVKAKSRETRVPWLIDAHSGKGEDQSDDADPIQALRGASAAAGSADYILSLRYADGAFGTQRRFSGRGRLVNAPPQTISYNPEDGTYESLGSAKDAGRETTWRQIEVTGAVTEEPRSAGAIAIAAGLADSKGRVSGGVRKSVTAALKDREGVTATSSTYQGKKVTKYFLTVEDAANRQTWGRANEAQPSVSIAQSPSSPIGDREGDPHRLAGGEARGHSPQSPSIASHGKGE